MNELILFEGHEVRTVEYDGEVWLPLMDLSIAWGLDRTTLPKHIDRNADFFEGCSRRVDIMSHDGTESLICVNEEGLYLLLARISKGKVKNPNVKTSITRFRKMVPKLIRHERRRTGDLKTEIARARQIAQEVGCDPKEFMKIALGKCGMSDYAPALDTPITHGEPGQWMNPTELGRECSLEPRQVNSWLYNHDFQYPQGPLWRLTAKGEGYGEEYIYNTVSKHAEVRIRWHRSIMVASGLKRPVDESQLALIS